MNESFGIGQRNGVLDFVRRQLPHFAERLSLCPVATSELTRHFEASLLACGERMDAMMTMPYVPAIPEARELIDYLAPLLIGGNSRLVGANHLATAMEYQRQGGNVLLVSNHASGADTLLLDYLVNQAFGNAGHGWHYMAGHVVNLFLIPLALSAAVNRIQIFSVKYRSEGIGDPAFDMARCNMLAMRRVAQIASQGGQLIVLYPEGGRGDGCLKEGEPRTMKIPKVMRTTSPQGLMILPSYVDGSTNILPVVRSENEFNEFLNHARRGTGTVSFGQPVNWDDLMGDESMHTDAPGNLPPEHALNRRLITTVMGTIANLAPNERTKGPYTQQKEVA